MKICAVFFVSYQQPNESMTGQCQLLLYTYLTVPEQRKTIMWRRMDNKVILKYLLRKYDGRFLIIEFYILIYLWGNKLSTGITLAIKWGLLYYVFISK